MNIDVLVLGGGPAGLIAAAILAGRGRRVLLVSDGRPPRVRGELLSLAAETMLNEIDHRLFDRKKHLSTTLHRSDWNNRQTIDAAASLSNRRWAWHLDRRSFDADLERIALLKGALIHQGRKVKSSIWCSATAIWNVKLNDHSCWAAKLVIDATGRNCSFARQNGGTWIRTDDLIATSAVVPSASSRCEFRLQSRPDGWWYATMVPGHQVVACFISDIGSMPRGVIARRKYWLEQLQEASMVGDYVSLPENLAIQSVPAGSGYLESAIGDGWLAIGDAALTVDPLASAGITHAIKTARLGALAADAALVGELRLLGAYRRHVLQMAENSDISKRAYYAIEQRWRSSFWSRRLNTAPSSPHGQGSSSGAAAPYDL